MKLYLIRHGKDDESIRGGWSRHSLSDEGRIQAQMLAEFFKRNEQQFAIRMIYSSDLPRAAETAEEVSQTLQLPFKTLPEFREVNNGELAGMKNEIAAKQFPEYYWNLMDWNQPYPNGESPSAFYNRISSVWAQFSQVLTQQNENCILVTHGGVLQVLLCLVNGIIYDNKVSHRKIKPSEIITLEYTNNVWKEIR